MSSATVTRRSRGFHLQAIQCITIILVFFWVGLLKVLKIGSHVLLSHLMANWSQRRQFDYPVSAVVSLGRHAPTLIVSIDAGSIIDDRCV